MARAGMLGLGGWAWLVLGLARVDAGACSATLAGPGAREASTCVGDELFFRYEGNGRALAGNGYLALIVVLMFCEVAT